jgi:hypothetical protein
MVGVFTYYCNDEATLTDIENSAQSKPDVLFTSKGDKVIKVCSESGFTSDKGKITVVLMEQHYCFQFTKIILPFCTT